VGYSQQQYGGTVSMSHVTNLYSGITEDDAIDDYAVVNLSAYFRLNPHVQFHLNLENLFSADYETVKGYFMPGRTFLGKMNYVF
jgi:outer membrane cobalamin receptor